MDKPVIKNKIENNEVKSPCPTWCRMDTLAVVFIFLAAIIIRIIYLYQISSGILFTPTEATLDEFHYHTWAKEIAFKDFIGKDAFWGFPLYPYLLGSVYFLFGDNVFIARLIQFFIGSASCVLIFLIGRKCFGRSIGVLAGALFAFYNTAIYHDGMIVSSALGIFLNLLVILSVLLFIDKPSYPKAVAAGILFGLSGLTSPVVFMFLPFVLIFYIKDIKKSVLMLALCLLVISPVTVRNYVLEKDIIPITAHGGITFYAGNNEDSDGTYKLPRSLGADVSTTRMYSKMIAEDKLGRKLKPSEVSGFWFRQGVNYITGHPSEYLKLLFKKFELFWNYYDNSDIFDMYVFAEQFAPVLTLPLVNFALISGLAMLGIMLSFIFTEKRARLLDIYVIVYILSLLMYFVNPRYRLNVVPVLVIFAAYAVFVMYGFFIKNKRALFALCMIGLVFAYFFVGKKLTRQSPETAFNNIGTIYAYLKNYDKAIESYEAAIKANPDFGPAYSNLGIAYKRLGDFDKAVANYKKAILISPDYIEAHYNLGLCYRDMGDFGNAIKSFNNALAVSPQYKPAHEELAECYRAIGDSKNADHHSHFAAGQ